MAARKWMFRGLRPLYSFEVVIAALKRCATQKRGALWIESSRKSHCDPSRSMVTNGRDMARIVFRQRGCYHPISAREWEGWFMSDNNSNSLLWFLAGLGSAPPPGFCMLHVPATKRGR